MTSIACSGTPARASANERSEVTIGHAVIRTRGVARTAIWVGDHATTTINDSDIAVEDGVLPTDYSWSRIDPARSRDVMLELPWMLGLRGNNRATLVVTDGTAIYNNTPIRAERWEAFSTDDPRGEIKL